MCLRSCIAHWLGEQALAWSGLPVITIRPTMLLEAFFPLAASTVRERGRTKLPFGQGKTSPVAAADVARVVAAVLAEPRPHLGRVYELTGPLSQDMHGVAREYSSALTREITYTDIPHEEWERGLKQAGVPDHVRESCRFGLHMRVQRSRVSIVRRACGGPS